MQFPLLQKLFQEASQGNALWVAQLLAEANADSTAEERVQQALRLFARYGPQIEQEAFAQADARLRNYEGMPSTEEYRATVEAVYVAAAYSRLAMTLAIAFAPRHP